MRVTGNSSYMSVAWSEVLVKRPDAHQRFLDIVVKWLLSDPAIRRCVRALIGNDQRPIGENALEMFEVNAKRNWGSISVRPKKDFHALVIACGRRDKVAAEWVYTKHKSFWVSTQL